MFRTEQAALTRLTKRLALAIILRLRFGDLIFQRADIRQIAGGFRKDLLKVGKAFLRAVFHAQPLLRHHFTHMVACSGNPPDAGIEFFLSAVHMRGEIADHAADAIADAVQTAMQRLKLLRITLHGFQQGTQIERTAHGECRIQHRKADQHNRRNIRHVQRNLIHERLDQRIDHAHNQHGKHRPRRRGQRTDIAVQVQRLLRIIPVSDMKQRLHRKARDILQQRRSHRSDQRNTCDIVFHRHAGQQNADRAKSINRQNRSEQKAAVDEAPFLHDVQKDLPAVAAEAVKEKQQHPLTDAVFFQQQRLDLIKQLFPSPAFC